MKTKLLPPFVAVVVLCVLLGAGIASASSTRLAGPQNSKTPGPVLLTSYAGNDGPKASLVLTGGIADFGQAVRTAANGSNKKDYNQLLLTMTHGSFQLDISAIED